MHTSGVINPLNIWEWIYFDCSAIRCGVRSVVWCGVTHGFDAKHPVRVREWCLQPSAITDWVGFATRGVVEVHLEGLGMDITNILSTSVRIRKKDDVNQ